MGGGNNTTICEEYDNNRQRQYKHQDIDVETYHLELAY